jgi:hypothetical protein
MSCYAQFYLKGDTEPTTLPIQKHDQRRIEAQAHMHMHLWDPGPFQRAVLGLPMIRRKLIVPCRQNVLRPLFVRVCLILRTQVCHWRIC